MHRQAVIAIAACAQVAFVGNALAADVKSLTQDEQIARVKELRKEKKYGEALKLLDEMIGPVTRKDPIPKQRGWAFGNLEVRKEKAMIVEEFATEVPKITIFGVRLGHHFWGNAVGEWVSIIKAFAPTSAKPLYCELFVEQKRCTLMAYTNLGVTATKGRQEDWDAKIQSLASDFHDVLSKVRDLDPKVRARVFEIVAGHPQLADEFKRRGLRLLPNK